MNILLLIFSVALLLLLLVLVQFSEQAIRIIVILKVTKDIPHKIPYHLELKKLLPGEIPKPIQEAFTKISGGLQAHNLVKVVDLTWEGSSGYLSLYRDDNEKSMVKILATSPRKEFISCALTVSTYFTDGTGVHSTNILPSSPNTRPDETGRYFPDCMPEDLLRLHKEYIANQTPPPKKKELPEDLLKFLEKENQEDVESKIKKGQLKKDKDEKYLKYSFLYRFSLVSFVLKQKEGRPVKHPGLITDLPYTRGFANWLNPASPQAQPYRAGAPDHEKKKRKWRWEFIVPLFIILVLVLNYLPNIMNRGDYPKYSQEHYRKLYTFGQVQVSPLAESLEKIGKWFETYNHPASRSMQPGLSREQIQQALKDLPLTIPGELFTLYSWHNGQQTAPGAEFIPAFSFLSLQEAVKTYRELRGLADEAWPPYYFPIFSFEGEYYVVLCGGEKPGSVVELLLEDPAPAAAYPSIAVLMQEIAESFDTGAYYIDDEGVFKADDDKAQKIFKKYHPALPSRYALLDFNDTDTAVNPDGSKVITSTSDDGFKRIKYFDSRWMLIKQEFYGNAGLQEVISNRYNPEGKILERVYLHMDIGGKKSEHRVKWEYNPNGTVTITKEYPGSDFKEIVEAGVDRTEKWVVINIERIPPT